MGGSSRRNARLIALAAAVASATLTNRALAATQYWDANGATVGAGGVATAETWGVDSFWSVSRRHVSDYRLDTGHHRNLLRRHRRVQLVHCHGQRYAIGRRDQLPRRLLDPRRTGH